MRSVHHTKMYLRNGKIKTKPIDLDDSDGSMPLPQHESRNDSQLEQLKSKPVNSDTDAMQKAQTSLVIHEVKSKVLRRRPSINPSLKSVRNHKDGSRVPKGVNADNLKRRQPVEPFENRTTQHPYCCYLCGKTFQFLCRLKVKSYMRL